MPAAAPGGVLAAVRQLVPLDPDAELLHRFAATRDGDAFAHLVARYGRLVLAVCRRTVPDAHLAEDAFQATFVVLAAKAQSLDAHRPLGPWLHRVACHVAGRARAMLARRRKRESLTGTVPESPAAGPPASDDAAAVLDEEIGRLSAAQRAAVVLCELQGLSRREAAGRLGIAEGTLSSRLAAARKALAARLRARGVTGPLVFAGVVVPPGLASATVAGALGPASGGVRELTYGALRTMLISKLQLTPVLVALGVALLGVGGWGRPRGDTAAAPVPQGTPDPGLIWLHDTTTDKLTAYTPDGKKAKELALPEGDRFLGFTPDGAKILFTRTGRPAPGEDAADGLTLHVRDVAGPPDGADTGLAYSPNDQFVLSPDGKQIVRQRLERIGGSGRPTPKHEFSHVLFDTATKKTRPIDLPTDHQVMGWSADGKTWRVVHNNLGTDPKVPGIRWLSVPVGGGKKAPLCDGISALWLDPSPDGTEFLAFGSAHPVGEPLRQCGYRVNAATGQARELMTFRGVAFVALLWSPGGKRIVGMKYDWDAANSRAGDTHLLLFDADGRNEKTLLDFTDDGQRTHLVGWYPTRPKAAPRR